VLPSLLALVNMILYGPNIQTQASDAKSQASLSIAQLMQYNSFVRRRGDLKRNRHSTARETPLSINIGMALHAKTRSRDLVDWLHDLGLCVSYDRVLAISSSLGNAVCHQYHRDNVTCLPSLRKNISTLSAVDNIDLNPSSTAASESFHETGISLFQQPTVQHPGVIRGRVPLNKRLLQIQSLLMSHQSPYSSSSCSTSQQLTPPPRACSVK